MVALIFGDDVNQQLAEWAAMQLPNVGQAGFGPCATIGVAAGTDDKSALYAVCVYHDYRPAYRNIQISFVARSPRWAQPNIIRALLAYPFVQLQCFKVWLAIEATNERALRLNYGLGMVREANLRHHFGRNRTAVIVSMIEPEWRKSRWYRAPRETMAA